jgi:hypothetical protein
MGLDATVYCNCFELQRLKDAPPCQSLFVADDGSLDCRSEELDSLLAFDRWRLNACEHPNGILLHHRIGNVAQVGLLRSELNREPTAFPILLSRVLYSGMHAGDYLLPKEFGDVASEVERLGRLVCSTPPNQEFVDSFRKQMGELIEVALRVAKPISF